MGDKLDTNFKDVFDFPVTASYHLDSEIASYSTNAQSDKNVFYNSLNTCTPQGSGVNYYKNCRLLAQLQLRENIGNHRIQYIQTRRTNFTNTVNNFQTLHNTAKGSADVTLKPLLRLQDKFKNAIVETT